MRPRPPSNPEALVAYRIQELRKKFEYPDELGGGAPAQAGGGGGAPTIVIAASNATEFSKAKADFICTGTDDHEVIDTALTLLGTGGGRILLTEGIFNITTNQISHTSKYHIQGLGIEQTIIRTTSASGNMIGSSGAISTIVSELTLEATTSPNTVTGAVFGVDGIIRNVQGINLELLADIDGAQCAALFCITQACDNMIDIANNADQSVAIGNYGDGGIRIGSADRTVIADNTVTSSAGVGIQVDGAAQIVAIVGNVVSNSVGNGIDLGDGLGIGFTVVGNTVNGGVDGIRYNRQRDVVISGNAINSPNSNGIAGSHDGALEHGAGAVISNNNILEPGAAGMLITGRAGGGIPYPILIDGNKIRSAGTVGMSFDDISEVVIQGNLIWEPDEHGITTVDQCNDFHVHGNTIIRASDAADNVSDGIFLNTNCSRWFIHGNDIVGDPTAGSRPRYGVNISAASDVCNIVVGNSFGPTADYGTDALNNAGADTQLFWPNDVTYGDNFIGCYGS